MLLLRPHLPGCPPLDCLWFKDLRQLYSLRKSPASSAQHASILVCCSVPIAATGITPRTDSMLPTLCVPSVQAHITKTPTTILWPVVRGPQRLTPPPLQWWIELLAPIPPLLELWQVTPCQLFQVPVLAPPLHPEMAHSLHHDAVGSLSWCTCYCSHWRNQYLKEEACSLRLWMGAGGEALTGRSDFAFVFFFHVLLSGGFGLGAFPPLSWYYMYSFIYRLPQLAFWLASGPIVVIILSPPYLLFFLSVHTGDCTCT